MFFGKRTAKYLMNIVIYTPVTVTCLNIYTEIRLEGSFQITIQMKTYWVQSVAALLSIPKGRIKVTQRSLKTTGQGQQPTSREKRHHPKNVEFVRACL